MNKKIVIISAILAIFTLATIQATSAAARGAIKYSCSDTDGGNVITTFGTVSGYFNKVWYSNSDYCVDAGNIMEYYCSGNYKQNSQQSCGTDFYGSAYCSANLVYKDYTDYYCMSGECDNSVTPTLQENCDSYDGYVGSNYCMSGDVYKDYKDYYCSSGACSYTTTPTLQQDCVDGQYCSGGACYWNNTCSDSDGGYDMWTQGTASGYYTGQPYSYTDFCNSTTLLIEYICSGTTATWYPFDCSLTNTTTACSNGACV